MISHIGPIDRAFSARLKTIARCQISSTIILPGPTGETNTLRYEPRGMIVAAVQGDTPDHIEGVFKALVAGNSVFVDLAGHSGTLLDHLIKAAALSGLLRNALILLPDGLAAAFIDQDINGFVLAEEGFDLIATATTLRPGSILPILSAHDPVERFCVERTVTVDTTAAGGNASLLAMV